METKTVKYINIHSHTIDNEQFAINIFNLFANEIIVIDAEIPDLYYSIGIHPWHIPISDFEKALTQLRKLLLNNKIVALGEVGLDRYIDTPIQEQINLFVQQLDLNNSIKKPVIIHCVKAFPELISIKKRYHKDVCWIIHGFNSNIEILKQLIKNGFYISIGEAILKYPEKAKNILKFIPDNKLFLETDNATISIKTVYKKVAEMKMIKEEILLKRIFENFNHCFKKK